MSGSRAPSRPARRRGADGYIRRVAATSWNQQTIDEFHDKNGLGVGRWGDHLLLMTAKGAKSGEPHTTPLVYVRDGDRYVITGSKGGAPVDPTWVANLKANPDVEVEVAKAGGTEKFKARAQVIGSGPERDRLYLELAKVWPSFLDYEKKTSRLIPVIVLDRSTD